MLAAFAATLDAAAQPAADTFCGQPMPVAASRPDSLQLKPRDEGQRRPDFAEFRRRFQEAVARRDFDALSFFVDPGVRVDFGDGGGVETLKQQLRDGGGELWIELARVLALGGRFTSATSFEAPYVAADWPDALDPFECAAIVGSGVRVRAAPRPDARVVTGLSHAIVHVLSPPDAGWVHVRLVTGLRGYVASSLVRSAVSYRAFFAFKDGRWWLMSFVAGD